MPVLRDIIPAISLVVAGYSMDIPNTCLRPIDISYTWSAVVRDIHVLTYSVWRDWHYERGREHDGHGHRGW